MDPMRELERKKEGLPSSIYEAIKSFWTDMVPVENYEHEWFVAFIVSWFAYGRISKEDMLSSVFVYEQLYQKRIAIN